MLLLALALCHPHEKDMLFPWFQKEDERLVEQSEVTPVFPSEAFSDQQPVNPQTGEQVLAKSTEPGSKQLDAADP